MRLARPPRPRRALGSRLALGQSPSRGHLPGVAAPRWQQSCPGHAIGDRLPEAWRPMGRTPTSGRRPPEGAHLRPGGSCPLRGPGRRRLVCGHRPPCRGAAPPAGARAFGASAKLRCHPSGAQHLNSFILVAGVTVWWISRMIKGETIFCTMAPNRCKSGCLFLRLTKSGKGATTMAPRPLGGGHVTIWFAVSCQGA